jgi:predicted nuclease of predicted toxin-antitoxin system
VRFVLDNNVDVAVGAMLRRRRHKCWTAADAGLHNVPDDDLTVYAQRKQAVLVTHDREFSQRRGKQVIGKHLHLRCDPWEAARLLEAHLGDVVANLERHVDVLIALSAKGYEVRL